MYKFELPVLHSDIIQQETLQMLENISEEFQLQDDFGFISLAIHELIEQVILIYPETEWPISLECNLYPDQLSIALHHSLSLSSLNELMKNVDLHNDSSLFAIQQLTDVIEFSDNEQEVKISFHVKPVFNHLEERRNQFSFDPYSEKKSEKSKNDM